MSNSHLSRKKQEDLRPRTNTSSLTWEKDDLFGAPEDGDEVGEYEQYEDEPDEEDSSSSGCEPDMVKFLCDI